jgi:SpoVK/Ycf46/Vps4 family AAA+-type ATPase
MKEVLRLLDENNNKSVEPQSQTTSNSNGCCSNEDTPNNATHSKEELDKLLNKVNNNFDNSNLNYGWSHKEMIKYKCEKYDPNLYHDYSKPVPIPGLVINGNGNKTRINLNKLFNALKNERYPITIDSVKKEKITIETEINSIDDLLKLVKDYPLDDTKEYNINLSALHRISPYLERLNKMIGMKDLKENILDQILYFIQDLHKCTNNSSQGDFMHTVIYGPPGTGKTEVARIIGKIFSKLDILKKGTFKKVTRTDLVAGYLGQTATKTNDVIKECLGGVLFIDEAYALGNSEKRDSFSKECIDTLCEALSNHKDNLMVIIAGYESELKECFFAYNQGLESRFNWRFKTGEYSGKELYDIFVKKVDTAGWTIDENETIDAKWFENKKVYFKYFGRDIETIFSKAKIAHSRRIFGKSEDNKKKLCKKDLEKGFDNFLKIDDVKNRKEEADHSKRLSMLYL